jgi:hypothetical protein
LPPAIANFVRAFLIETWEKRSPMDSLSYLSGRLDVEITFLLERLRLLLQQGESIQQVFHDKLTQVSNPKTSVFVIGDEFSNAYSSNTYQNKFWLKN